MKSKFIVTFLCILGLTTALLFNNCQPIGDSLKGESSGPSLGGGPIPLTAGENFFQQSLAPALETNCAGCHAEGGIAPTTIYDYDTMKALLEAGPFAQDNAFVNKLNGGLTHGGAALCLADATICDLIRDWSLNEYPLQTNGIAGALLQNDALGRIRGWVQNPAEQNLILEAHVYAGGAFDAVDATLIGVFTANEPLVGAEYGDGHAFSFQLPEEFRNGLPVELRVYGVPAAVAVTAETLVSLMPVERAGFSPTVAGETYYEANLTPVLEAQCLACHENDMNYGVNWLRLANPSPFETGTATNNEVINMITSEDHPGGVFCDGDKNTDFCLSLQQWWRFEFPQVSVAALSGQQVNRLEIVGDQVIAGSFNLPNLNISNDAGNIFAPSIIAAGVRDIYAEPGRILAATSAGVFLSEDNGVTFTLLASLPAIPFARVYANGDRVLVTDNTTYYISNDAGATFEARPLSIDGVGAPTLRAVEYVIDGDNIYVVTLTGVEVSRDGGATYTTTATFPSSGHYMDVSGNDIFVTAVNGGFWRSTDAGASFERVGGLESDGTFGVYMAPNGILYVGTRNGLLASLDKGDTFIPVPIAGFVAGENNSRIWRVRSMPNGELFVGTNQGLFRSK